MVALTTMLVLAAFFTQNSNTIPKTAYLKLIDVWYIVLICQVFAIIVSLVHVENLRLKFELHKIKICFQWQKETKNQIFHKANRYYLIFFSCITAAIFVNFIGFIVTTSEQRYIGYPHLHTRNFCIYQSYVRTPVEHQHRLEIHV